MLNEKDAKRLAENAIEVANEKLEDGGWDSRVTLSEVFQDVEGNWLVEVVHGQETWGENTVYELENADVEELAESMKEDCAFIEGDDSEWGDDWDSDDDDDDYWGDDD